MPTAYDREPAQESYFPVISSLSSTDATARRLEAAVAARIGSARFALWFQGHARFLPSADRITVGVPNAHFQEWLGQTFGSAVEAAAGEVYGIAVPVVFSVIPTAFEEAATKEALRQPGPNLFGERPPPLPVKPKKAKPSSESETGPKTGRRWKQLGDFVTGSCNRVAHASAVGTVDEPGQAANPLVIHGPVGTGKTHLLEGIASGLRRKWPELRPTYVTAEEFTSRFVQSCRFGKQSAFRRQFRDCHALLLDDLHFLATKRGSQEEFLHTLDAVSGDGRQVVVTMDCHPRLADDLMPELADRLLGGAVWGLLPPDDATRLGILWQKAGAGAISIPEDVLSFLAQHLRGNVRELEGAINGVRHFARVTGRAVDIALAREALGDLLRHAVRAVSLADVEAAVLGLLRLPSGALQSKARSWAVTHPRMLAIFLARKHTAATYGEIAKHFGVKTHSTAVAAEKKVRAWITADAAVPVGDREWRAKDLLDRIERELAR